MCWFLSFYFILTNVSTWKHRKKDAIFDYQFQRPHFMVICPVALSLWQDRLLPQEPGFLQGGLSSYFSTSPNMATILWTNLKIMDPLASQNPPRSHLFPEACHQAIKFPTWEENMGLALGAKDLISELSELRVQNLSLPFMKCSTKSFNFSSPVSSSRRSRSYSIMDRLISNLLWTYIKSLDSVWTA